MGFQKQAHLLGCIFCFVCCVAWQVRVQRESVTDLGVNDHRGLRGVVGKYFAHLLEVAGRGTGVFTGYILSHGAFSARAASIPRGRPCQRGEARPAP